MDDSNVLQGVPLEWLESPEGLERAAPIFDRNRDIMQRIARQSGSSQSAPAEGQIAERKPDTCLSGSKALAVGEEL